MAAIVFDRVSKSFPRHRGQMLLRDRMLNLLRRGSQERFQALKEISFSIDHGESVAIIGHNGAGKSTTLNLATGLSRPDSGVVTMEGRIAPMLELGSGFHPDLTGAENVLINAALLGLSRQKARYRFDEIVEFADIDDFIHEPLRTYSSGMIMRLAFAVAVHVDPEILIIDEVLGVGDHAFFGKCVERIKQFRRSGKTLLCVSHSKTILKDLCDRGLWLDHGRLLEDGPIDRTLEAYEEAAKGRPVRANA